MFRQSQIMWLLSIHQQLTFLTTFYHAHKPPLSVVTSSTEDVGYPARIKYHRCRQIQMVVSTQVYEHFQIQILVPTRTHITDL
jgi:hypothetical protein